MKTTIRALILAALATAGLAATEARTANSLGLQAGLALPTGGDLKVTAGSGVSPVLGLHGDIQLNEFSRLRPRLDLIRFPRAHQDAGAPLAQHVETRDQAVAYGCEYLCDFGQPEGAWALGAGIYLIRWSVESTNSVSVPGAGSAAASGTSHWTREGLGMLATRRLGPRLDAEIRWISSHYGYENLPVQFGTVGLLWHF